MEKPARQLLLSELRVRNAAYDVSLGSSLLTWKRRVASPVYHPFKPSKSCLFAPRVCVNASRADIVFVPLSLLFPPSVSYVPASANAPRHQQRTRQGHAANCLCLKLDLTLISTPNNDSPRWPRSIKWHISAYITRSIWEETEYAEVSVEFKSGEQLPGLRHVSTLRNFCCC